MKLLQKMEQLEDTEWFFKNRRGNLKLLWCVVEELGYKEEVEERLKEWVKNAAQNIEEREGEEGEERDEDGEEE